MVLDVSTHQSSRPEAAPETSSRIRGLAKTSGGQAALITLGRILTGLVVSLIALWLLPVGHAIGVGNPNSIGGSFLHWDSVWYHDVAEFGYTSSIAARTAFFPVYPFLLQLLLSARIPFPVAAIGLSWIGLFFATWAAIELCRSLFPGTKAARAGLFLVWLPLSVFLLSGYAESMLAAFAGWSFVLVVRRQPLQASALAGLAAVTRPEGILVGTAVVVSLCLRRDLRRASMAAVTWLSGIAGFTLFCWVQYGHPFEYIRVQRLWHRETTAPFLVIVRSVRHVFAGWFLDHNYLLEVLVEDLLVLGGLVGAIYLIRLAWRAKRLWPFVPYVVGTVVLAGSNGAFGFLPDGSGRIMLGVTPLMALMARVPRSAWRVVLAASVVLAVVLQALFNGGRYIL